MTDHVQNVRDALVTKMAALAKEFVERERQITEFDTAIQLYRSHQATLQEQAQQCYATAALFEFDLTAAMAEAAATLTDAPPISAMPERVVAPLKIKDFVLAEAMSAYPNPVQAADLRANLSQRGLEVHEKTIGMTLYRHLKQGAIRREGRRWFFVPEDQRERRTEDAV